MTVWSGRILGLGGLTLPGLPPPRSTPLPGLGGPNACPAGLQRARIFRPLGKAPGTLPPGRGEGVSCQVTEDPDAPRPR